MALQVTVDMMTDVDAESDWIAEADQQRSQLQACEALAADFMWDHEEECV